MTVDTVRGWDFAATAAFAAAMRRRGNALTWHLEEVGRLPGLTDWRGGASVQDLWDDPGDAYEADAREQRRREYETEARDIVGLTDSLDNDAARKLQDLADGETGSLSRPSSALLPVTSSVMRSLLDNPGHAGDLMPPPPPGSADKPVTQEQMIRWRDGLTPAQLSEV